jgi:hypothetical protein
VDRAAGTACCVLIALAAAPSPTLTAATTGQLLGVRSCEYVIGSGLGTPGIYPALAGSPADLIILGGGQYDGPLDRAAADPAGTKLFFGYRDVSEAAQWSDPGLFSSGTLPSWFGNANPGYSGLYSVQYWNPAWEPLIFASIDQMIANGYDGAFLDVLGGDYEWSAGNDLGNPVYANATGAMATLLADIRAHIVTKHPGLRFYLIGNNPYGIAQTFPADLANLDAVLNEVAYYGQDPNNGAVASYIGTSHARFVSSVLAPIYAAAGLPVFGVDYPTPLSDPTADFLGFNLYSSLGWVPSVTTPFQSDAIFSTGPFMFMATPSNSTATGAPGFVNFLSGGLSPNATLIGGNQGDYFLGGPGQNTILGGAGDDTIYAHPADSDLKGVLDVQVNETSSNGLKATVTVLINGRIAIPPTSVTADANQGQTQDLRVNLAEYAPVSSLEIEGNNITYADSSSFNNLYVTSILLDGAPLSFTDGVYSAYSNPEDGGTEALLNYEGTVSFSGSALPVVSPFLPNTSDAIDGGGGDNVVIYRSSYGNYSVSRNADGSWLVTSLATAEGPDTLKNIQTLVFSDRTIPLNGLSAPPPIRTQPSSQTVNAGSDVVLAVAASGSAPLGYQWYFNGSPISGGTGPTLFLPDVQAANGGVYSVTVTDSFGAATTSDNATLSISLPVSSILAGQPISQTVAIGSTATFSVSSSASAAYQWQFNGVNLADGGAISGSTGPELEITGAGASDDGDYSCIVTSAGGSFQSNTAGLLVAAVQSPGTLVNLSSRAFVGTGDGILIGGFFIGGSTSRTLLIQALGPALSGEGVTGVLQHPALTIHDSTGATIRANTGWGSSPMLLGAAAAAYAQPALQPGSGDSEVLLTLPPGGYTAEVNGADGGTGIALCAIYQLP